MAIINLGRVGYVHKGAYAAATTYQKYDVVLYNHGSYLYIGDTASQGHAPTDTAYWQAMLDPSAMQEATEAAVNAAEAAHASAMELASQVDRLTTPFSITGDMVNCHPVSDYPLSVISHIAPVQAGSGDPSPSNVRPITGWTGASLTRTGKNLLKITAPSGSQAGVTFTVDNGTVIVNGTTTDRVYFYLRDPIILPPGTYTMSGTPSGIDSVSEGVFYDDNHNLRPEGTATVSNDFYVRPYLRLEAGVTFNNAIFRPQIESGNKATPFEPYQGTQFTAQFGQSVYGGELDWKTGVLKKTAVLQSFTGDENWIEDNWGVPVFYVYQPEVLSTVATSHFKNDLYVMDGTIIFNNAAYGYTLQEWKNYLSSQYAAGTPVQICYKVAAPEVIQLTPQQILSVSGENNLWSDTGETTVNGPNSPKVMEDRIAALEAAVLNA